MYASLYLGLNLGLGLGFALRLRPIVILVAVEVGRDWRRAAESRLGLEESFG